MEPLPIITLGVTALFVLLNLPMSVAVGVRRSKTGILLLHGEDDRLLRLIRAHGNFTEYVPLALLALAGAEILGSPTWLVALCGGLLLLGRVTHYLALQTAADSPGRPVGALMTNAAMLVLALAILWQLSALV